MGQSFAPCTGLNWYAVCHGYDKTGFRFTQFAHFWPLEYGIAELGWLRNSATGNNHETSTTKSRKLWNCSFSVRFFHNRISGSALRQPSQVEIHEGKNFRRLHKQIIISLAWITPRDIVSSHFLAFFTMRNTKEGFNFLGSHQICILYSFLYKQ
jgi:hypothetical protein